MSNEDQERCLKHDMVRAYCADCSDAKPVVEDTRPLLDVIVVAEFEGQCGECGESIMPGDHIGVSEEVKDQHGNVVRKIWAHYGCGR
jgi:hypothetical protein